MNNFINSWRNRKNKYRYLDKIGKIVCLTRIYSSTADFSKYVPYFVGIIEFENKEKIAGQIINEKKGAIKIGTKVIGIIRKGRETASNEIVDYLVKFLVL